MTAVHCSFVHQLQPVSLPATQAPKSGEGRNAGDASPSIIFKENKMWKVLSQHFSCHCHLSHDGLRCLLRAFVFAVFISSHSTFLVATVALSTVFEPRRTVLCRFLPKFHAFRQVLEIVGYYIFLLANDHCGSHSARWFLATFLEPNDFGLYLLCVLCRYTRNVCPGA